VNINTIRSYYPAFKRLGLLYNTNENNSVVKMQEIAKLAGEMDFEFVALELELGADGKPKSESIPLRMAELDAAGVDFIYLGSSSFLDVHRDLFTQSAVDHGIPVLSPYERLVRDSHALLSIAARYTDVGALAGRQVKSILVGGNKPGDLPVLSVDQYAYVVNMTTAKKLNMFPSVEILQIAETVE
jgi:putative ABC transport system substrate-binding protein